MPLALTKRTGSRYWYVRGTVRGQSIVESTGTADATQAEGYRAKREAELWANSVYGARATAGFAQAVESYLTVEPRSPATKRFVTKLIGHFGNVPLRQITQEAVDRAYPKLLTPRAGNATKLRSVLTPLRAILEHAAGRQWCDRPSFRTPKQAKVKSTFLRPDQATALVHAAAPHLRPLLVFLFCVGPRLSEALELEWSAVDLAGARCILAQKQGTERHADLPPAAVAALSALPHRDGLVFRPARNNRKALAADGYRNDGRQTGGQIRTGWAGACSRAGLPGRKIEYLRKDRPGSVFRFQPEFTPHDCRHSWATWHYCVHRDLLQLRDDGGWEQIGMVTRYAKKMPDHYREAVLAWWGIDQNEKRMRA